MVLNKGEDPHKLGRWAWMLMQGRHGHHPRMVSAYRPNKSLTTAGTEYRQQLRHWRDRNKFECPLKLFDEHLEEEIKGWLLLGDHLMIGINANEDVRTGTVATMMRRLGLRDLLLDGLLQGTEAPETNIRNTNSMPIDAIFVTPGLLAAIGGFSRYNQMAMSDHRMPWADIPNEYFLGHNPPKKTPPTFRRINGKDPRLRDKNNKLTKKEYAKAENTIPAKLANLQQLGRQSRCFRCDVGTPTTAGILHENKTGNGPSNTTLLLRKLRMVTGMDQIGQNSEILGFGKKKVSHKNQRQDTAEIVETSILARRMPANTRRRMQIEVGRGQNSI